MPIRIRDPEERMKEAREIVKGVYVQKKDSQKFVEDLLSAGNPVWIWVERISHMVCPALLIFIMILIKG